MGVASVYVNGFYNIFQVEGPILVDGASGMG
jgi:hypothetical protein